MAYKRILLGMVVLALLVPVLATQPQRRAAAAPDRRTPGTVTAENLWASFVLDTSAGMQPALDTLARVWDDTDIVQVNGTNPTYDLTTYKDAVTDHGSTGDPATFQQWLDELAASGGGDCPDAVFQGLLAAAWALPDVPYSGAGDEKSLLLLGGSAPQGGRAALARTIALLGQADARVFPVVGDWCGDAELDPLSMRTLAIGTGGFPITLTPRPYLTATLQIALEDMTTPDVLLLDYDVERSGPFQDTYSFSLNFEEIRMFNITLGYKCVDCAPAVASSAGVQTPTWLLRDPQGNEITADACGNGNVTCIHTNNLSFVKVTDIVMEYNGDWILEVSGNNVSYDLAVSTNAPGYFDAELKRPGGAGEPAQIIAILIGLMNDPTGPPQGTAEATALGTGGVAFALQPASGGAPVPVELYDDGSHGDGRAGDGIYGGDVPPAVLSSPDRLYNLTLQFAFGDGSVHYQRVDPTPIHLPKFHLQGPQHATTQQDSTVVQSFTLTNESDETQTYDVELYSSQGWATFPSSLAPTASTALTSSVTLEPGASRTFDVAVHVPPDAYIGETEKTVLTAVGPDDALNSSTATAETVVVGPQAQYLPLLQRPDEP